MSTPTELLPRTSIAATSWATGDLYHLRVYTQDIQGRIRETRWDNGWTGGTVNDVIATAKPNSPLAVFNYDGGNSIRVYYLTNENIIQEICQDNKGAWFPGALNNAKVEASPASRLTAIGRTWNDGNITVYYQRPDLSIGEIKQDGTNWDQVNTIPNSKAILGTGLAALNFNTTNAGKGIRVYYQQPSGTLAEAAIDEGGQWYLGAFTAQGIDYASPATNIAIYQHGVDNPFLQVYFLDKQNAVTEWGYYSGSWKGSNHPRATSESPYTFSAPSSGIAVIPVSNPQDLRLYIQDEHNRIQEWVEAGGVYWNKGAQIPIGGLE